MISFLQPIRFTRLCNLKEVTWSSQAAVPVFSVERPFYEKSDLRVDWHGVMSNIYLTKNTFDGFYGPRNYWLSSGMKYLDFVIEKRSIPHWQTCAYKFEY